MANGPNTISNDPVRMRALASEISAMGKKWKAHMDELNAALRSLKHHCSDERIDEFERDFRNTRGFVETMSGELAETSKYLLIKADEFEKAQKI